MDPLVSPYALATSLKPSKAFAAAFAVMVAALAGCATGLGPEEGDKASSSVSRVEEGTVLAARADDGAYAYTVRLRSGELLAVADESAVSKGTPVLVEYGSAPRLIPQNHTIGY
jgi:hypothetical protein